MGGEIRVNVLTSGGGGQIERFLVLIRAEVPKVVQTNGLMHHSDNLLLLLFELLDLFPLSLQLGSGRHQIVIQANLVLGVIVV